MRGKRRGKGDGNDGRVKGECNKVQETDSKKV